MSLHAQIEAAIGQARKQLVAQARDSWVEDRPGYFLFAAAHPSRVIVNGAWLEEDIALDEALLSEISARFLKLRHDFSLYVPTGFTRAEDSLRDSPFVKRIVFQTMIREAAPAPFDDERTHAVEIFPVRTSEELDEFVKLCALCFEFSARTTGLCHALLGKWRPLANCHAFLLRLGRQPVATSMVQIVGGVANIDWVSTHPDFRRRGLGAIITSKALQTGFELGANSAVLHASSAGESLYRRLGFQEIGAMALYSPVNSPPTLPVFTPAWHSSTPPAP